MTFVINNTSQRKYWTPLLSLYCVDVLVESSLLLSLGLLIQQCYSFIQVNHVGGQFCNLQKEENPFIFSYSAAEKVLRPLTALERRRKMGLFPTCVLNSTHCINLFPDPDL